MKVAKSTHCCGVYEMEGVAHEPPDDATLDSILRKAKKSGMGRLPAIIQFSDADYVYGTGVHEDAKPLGGDRWMRFLVDKGYRVDKFMLGRNPKTYAYLAIYHWYPEKSNTPSRVREYIYGQEQEKPRTGVRKLGRASGQGVGSSTGARTGVRRLLRSRV